MKAFIAFIPNKLLLEGIHGFFRKLFYNLASTIIFVSFWSDSSLLISDYKMRNAQKTFSVHSIRVVITGKIFPGSAVVTYIYGDSASIQSVLKLVNKEENAYL